MVGLSYATRKAVRLFLCGWMLGGAVASTGCGGGDLASAPSTAAAPPQSEDEKLMYFLGAQLGRPLARYEFTDAEKALVAQGFREALAGKALELDSAVYLPQLQDLGKARQQAAATKEKEAARGFLAEAAAAKGARVTKSGLIFVPIREGSGDSPTATDSVRVHYHGTLRDGRVFDSSVERGTPDTFTLDRVIPCWTQGLAMMKVGGKATILCPPELAYGDVGTSSGIPGGAALKFEVELLEIVKSKTP